MKKIFVLIFILICSTAFAEKITLTTGQTIRGEFVSRGIDFVKVDTGLGVSVNYFLDEIESVDGEPFNISMLDGVPEALKERLEKPLETAEATPVEVPVEKLDQPDPVQEEKLNLEFMQVHGMVNEELEKGNVSRAFKLVEVLFDKCKDFEADRCLLTFNKYISVTEYALIFIDEGGLYPKIEDYAKPFIDNIEAVADLGDVINRVDKLLGGENSSLGKLFQIYAFYGLYLASTKDIDGAKKFMLKTGKLDANVAKQLQGLLDPYEQIFSNRDYRALYDVVYDMKIRFSALLEATGVLKGLYDKFKLDPSAGESGIISQLGSHLDVVQKEVFSFKSKQEFNDRALPLFVYLLDSETPNFLVWYFQNFGKHSKDLKEEMNAKFRSAFVSMVNYMILKARGFDVYYVSTWANAIENSDTVSEEFSVFDIFGKKEKRVERVERSLCAVKISDKNFVFVDFVDKWISKKFSLQDVYEKKGAIYYEMKPNVDRKDIFDNFQLSKDAMVAPNVIFNLLLQMNRLGYQVELDDRSLKLARIKNPHNRNSYHLLAYINSEIGKISEAIDYLNMSLKDYQNDPETYYLMGQIYYDAKDYTKSIEVLNKVLEIDPGYSEAKLLLAYDYLGFSDYGTSLEKAKECLKDDPKNASIHIMLIQLYESFGNISAAKKHGYEAAKLLKLEGDKERADSVMQYVKSLKETPITKKKKKKYGK